jgi:uncharacterized protein YukE
MLGTFVLAAALATGCAPVEEKSAAGPTRGETAARREKAKTEVKEAARAIQDYAYAQKAELIDKMNKELVEIQNEVDRLAAKVDQSSDTAKEEAKTKVTALREKYIQAKKQLEQAESATESTWDEMKGRFKKSHGELKNSVDKTRQWLSDKIEP